MPGMKGTMREYKKGKLHSGSKSGPIVTERDQAIAIGLDQERKMGKKVPYKRKPHGSGVFTDDEMKRGYRSVEAGDVAYETTNPMSDNTEVPVPETYNQDWECPQAMMERSSPVSSKRRRGTDVD